MTTKHDPPAEGEDPRLRAYAEGLEQLLQGQQDVVFAPAESGNLARLGRALQALAEAWRIRRLEQQKLNRITARINAGLTLDDILQSVYVDFKELIPYDRIGCALLDDERKRVTAYWARSERPEILLGKGFSAPLEGSSLATILATGEPRVLNDLVAYLQSKPGSRSTRMIVEEGFRSSLTCPLIADGVPIGFVFFSSVEPNTYAGVHVESFKRLAGQLSVSVEKGRMTAELLERKSALERQNDELRRVNELKNAFVGMAAHDLRSPIATMQMMADLLMYPRMHLSEAEQQALIADIAHRTRQMFVLLNDLLDVTQIEAGRLELHLETISVPAFLAEVAQRHAMLAAAKGTHVVLDAAPEGVVRADAIRLGQALDNLLSNAVKYSPRGSTVRLAARQAGGQWYFHVRDEGPGVKPEDRTRLFTDFARLSARPTGDEMSTGLGLAITRRVIEAHGGRIGVDSEPGHGADFWFSLPDGREPASGDP